MKIVGKFLTVLFVAVLFINCSSDDSNDNDDNTTTTGDVSAELIGTWIMQSFEYQGETSTDIQGIPLEVDFDGEAFNIDASLVFTDSPNEFTSSGSYDIELSSTIAGETQTQTESIEDFESQGTWSRDDNTLTFDGSLIDAGTGAVVVGGMDFDMSEATILELTDTTLRLGQDMSEEFTQDGQTVSFSFTSEIVLTRQ